MCEGEVIKGSLGLFSKYRNCPHTYRCLPGHLLMTHICRLFRSNRIPWNFPTLHPKASHDTPLLPHPGFSTGFHFPVFPEKVCTFRIFKRAHTLHMTAVFSSLSLPLSWQPLWGLDCDACNWAHSRHSLTDAECTAPLKWHHSERLTCLSRR